MSKSQPTPTEIQKSMDSYKRLWKPEGVDGLTLPQLMAQRTALRQAMERIEQIKPNCGHCVHFALDRCDFHKQDVPVEFQKTEGECPDWIYDGVPF